MRLRRGSCHAGVLILAAVSTGGCTALDSGANTEEQPVDHDRSWVASAGERYKSDKGHFSLDAPGGWIVSPEAESDIVTFIRASRRKPLSNTILVQSAVLARNGTWVEDRKPAALFNATLGAIRALPGADVRSQTPLALENFPSSEVYEFSFQPPGKSGRRYERQHALLIGDRRVFHLMHTAPAGTLEGTRTAFLSLVTSFREEG